MPRKTKEENELDKEKVVKKSSTSKKTTAKKETKKTTTSTTKKTTAKKETPSKSKKTTTSKVTKSAKKKTTAKSKTTKTKSSSKKTSSITKSTKKKTEVLEYYDLPSSYNQTVVKVLAQTPTTLFVYWDISDYDKENYIKQYGEYFFNNTKPVLIVKNNTTHYSYEVDINDFANSWYLHVPDSNADYQIELGRRPINNYVAIKDNYLYVTSSNEIETPNDHILFDHLANNIYFKNVKTNNITKKDFVNLSILKKIGKISDIKEFYRELYPDESIDFDKLNLKNPSSATSTFK